eukprot:TRINITY_DN3431_c2_g1_i1.p1 TRINITY_DN3431_c2_g1~~TRINITY_DN3431_c2_g1_i1.p1  ORF type:complete len:143 (+),score=35.15 TRINITY_DN3431_c2_g1_i1:82-510(+)
MADQATERKVYTKEEVAKHNTPEDLWMVVQGRVYNVTPFLEEHPGGDGVLLDNAGVDSTEAFDDVGHSADATELMHTYYVGDLAGADPAPLAKKTAATSTAASTPATPAPAAAAAQANIWRQIAIPLVIIAIGLATRYYLLE